MTAADVGTAALLLVPVALWFMAYGVALAATRPLRPAADPATEDLGNEPPAVVSLLLNRWEVTEDAGESTLIDLAARRFLEFRQPANDPMQTTVHVRETNPAGLTPYERRVFNRVVDLAKGGVVPLTALTFRDSNEAGSWGKQLAAEVIADARSHGLSRRRFGTKVVTGLGAAAVAVAIVAAVATAAWLRHEHNDDTWQIAIGVGLAAFAILSAVAGRSHGERDTPSGRTVAARWLGVRDWLRAHEAFADLPPAAVTVWDRYLSYGAAVGATRVTSAVIDLGLGNRKRVWSSYAGASAPPSWHRVRIRYPRFWRRYGATAPRIALRSIIGIVIGVVFIRYWSHSVGSVFGGWGFGWGGPDSGAAAFASLVKGIGLLIGAVALGYGLYTMVRNVIDLAAPKTITGEVVWQELWRTKTSNDNTVPVLYYLAVDDATDPAIRAWALPQALWHTCRDTDVVAIKVRPWSRRVIEAAVVTRGTESRLSSADPVATSGHVDDMIATAMGIPNARPATSTAGSASTLGPMTGPLTGLFGSMTSTAGPLVSPDEVGAALGLTVAARPRNASPSPVDVTEFTGPDGSVVLTVLRSGGLIARQALRARAGRSEELSGIGDEARAGAGWVAARRGSGVVMLRLGKSAPAVAPVDLARLAALAVNRLPAAAAQTS